MPNLGPTLAVFSDVAICDGPYPHEARLITEGTTVLAYTMVCGYDLTVTREHTTLTAGCPDIHHGEPCPGTFTWDLATPAWTGERETIDLLTAYGTRVETTDAHDAAVKG